MILVVYNSILVIIDRLIKYIYFILYMKSSILEDLVYAFLRIIVLVYNMPKEIILDKDKLFISKFF